MFAVIVGGGDGLHDSEPRAGLSCHVGPLAIPAGRYYMAVIPLGVALVTQVVSRILPAHCSE